MDRCDEFSVDLDHYDEYRCLKLEIAELLCMELARKQKVRQYYRYRVLVLTDDDEANEC